MHASNPHLDLLKTLNWAKAIHFKRAMTKLGASEFGALVYLQKPEISWENTLQQDVQSQHPSTTRRTSVQQKSREDRAGPLVWEPKYSATLESNACN